MYKRVGTCNRCGECCGYPRATNGGQNNPWPPYNPDDFRTWSEESLRQSPFFSYIDHPHGDYSVRVLNAGGKSFQYRWLPDIGICRPNGNIMCPFLVDKPGPSRPCGLYATELHDFFLKNCSVFPPDYQTYEEVIYWFTNNPSCSYSFKEVPDTP